MTSGRWEGVCVRETRGVKPGPSQGPADPAVPRTGHPEARGAGPRAAPRLALRLGPGAGGHPPWGASELTRVRLWAPPGCRPCRWACLGQETEPLPEGPEGRAPRSAACLSVPSPHARRWPGPPWAWARRRLGVSASPRSQRHSSSRGGASCVVPSGGRPLCSAGGGWGPPAVVVSGRGGRAGRA